MKPSVETMMPKVLKPAGYVTACIGKWGQLPLGPAEFGFDDYLRFNGSGVYWNTQDKGKTYAVNGERKILRDKEYMPDLMHQHLDRLHHEAPRRPVLHLLLAVARACGNPAHAGQRAGQQGSVTRTTSPTWTSSSASWSPNSSA